MGNLNDYYKMTSDGDAWGDSMGAFFAVAAELYYRDADIPAEWQYRPGAFSNGDPRERDDAWFDECAAASTDELLKFGKALHRYTCMLERAGRSY